MDRKHFQPIHFKSILSGSLPFLSILLFIYFRPSYLPLNFSLFLGLLFAPFIIRKVEEEKSHRFFIPASLLGILLFFFPTNSLFYCFWLLVFLFLIEAGVGRLNNLPLFLGLVLSYICQQLLTNWSFPIRIQLSAWAGQLIATLGYNVQVTGNIIELDGIPFSVDPACMGLKMMITGQLLALVILAYFERKKQLTFRITEIGAYLLGVLALTVLANFIRILALVIFHIFPDHPLHELIGLFSLIVYTLLPFYYFIQYYTANRQAPRSPLRIGSPLNLFPKPIAPSFLIGLLLLHGIQAAQIHPSKQDPYPIESLQGFEQSLSDNGLLKLENDSTLIYIKPPVKFFQGNHDPRVCWTGSGYEFSNIQVEKLGTKKIYTAILRHKGDQFHTAWWYDNLQSQTIEEWQWRWEGLRGQDGYYLINVSSLERAELLRQVALFVN